MVKKEEERVGEIVVVGTGLWGRNLVRVFGELGVLRGVCDVDSEKARACLHDVQLLGCGGVGVGGVGDAKVFSWEEVCSDEGVKGVVLAVPVRYHYEMGCEVIERGKVLWVEKPMVVSLEEGESLVRRGRVRGVSVMVNHLMRYHGCVRKLLQMVSEGAVGRLGRVEMSRKGPGRIFEDADALYDLMPHDISVVQALMGEAELRDVRGWSGGWGVHQRDWVQAHLVYGGGESVSMSVSRLHPIKEQRTVVVGDRGMLIFDDRKPWRERLWYVDYGVERKGGGVVLHGGEGAYVETEEREPLREAGLHFVDVVRGTCEPLTSGEEALGGLRLIEAIKEGMECEARLV